MTRHILDAERIHADIRARVFGLHRDLIDEVEAAVQQHAVVVVGMRGNPMCRKARRDLEAAGIGFKYLEYGSYFSTWRRRNALKMWTGWPTFPMVFVKGTMIGGAHDLGKLLSAGELQRLLA